MAKSSKNKPQNRQPRQTPRQGQGEDMFEQHGQRRTEVRIPAETIQITNMSASINQKVKSLMGGLTSLKDFYLSKDENEEFKDFYDENKEQIESLLKYDLNGTYTDLVKNDQRRKHIYDELAQKGVISGTELNHLHGIISPQPFTNYVKALADRRPPTPPSNPPAAGVTPATAPVPPTFVPLTEDDQDNLKSAVNDNIQIIVDRLKSENKINDIEGQKLIELGPKTDQQIQEAREAVLAKIKSHDLTQHTNYYPQYLETLRVEDELETEMDRYIDRYDHVVGGLVKQIREALEEDQFEHFRKQRIVDLSKETGLPIHAGQVLWTNSWENVRSIKGDLNNRIEITGISFGEEESDPEMLPEFRKNVPSLEPIVEFLT